MDCPNSPAMSTDTLNVHYFWPIWSVHVLYTWHASVSQTALCFPAAALLKKRTLLTKCCHLLWPRMGRLGPLKEPSDSTLKDAVPLKCCLKQQPPRERESSCQIQKHLGNISVTTAHLPCPPLLSWQLGHCRVFWVGWSEKCHLLLESKTEWEQTV